MKDFEDYEPYGEEWINYMKTCSKKILIEMIVESQKEVKNREIQIMELQQELAKANEKLRLIAKECWGRRGINPADRLRQIREIVYEYKELLP